LFGQAQQILQANRAKAGVKVKPGRGEIRHMLARLATCPLCGGAMLRSNKGAGNGSEPRYVWSKAIQVTDGCKRVRVNVSDVEKGLIANADALANSIPSADTTLAENTAATRKALSVVTEQNWKLATLLDETPSKTVMQKIQAN
jgi:hypothetical protein